MDVFRRWPARLILLLTALLLAVAAACQGAEGPLFEDRFGNPRSGWGSDSQPAFDRGYQDGEYFVEVYEPDWFVWACPGERFRDVVVEVDVRWVSGSIDGHFGILCRYRSPGDFYYLGVTRDGHYAILRMEDGEPDVLTGAGFLPSPVIPTDGSVQQIRAVCDGDALGLFVNGEEVATASDETFRRGDVGVAVGSGPGGPVRVHFDNLVVTAAGEEEER